MNLGAQEANTNQQDERKGEREILNRWLLGRRRFLKLQDL